MKQSSLLLTLMLFGTSLAFAQTPAGSSPKKPMAAGQSQYKGIAEPLNYPEDLEFDSVFFINDQVGWVAGKGSGGMIMHTVDGGQHWTVQQGDPHSNDPTIRVLRFLDATHGWALQDGSKVLRTTDGTNWQIVGSVDFGNRPLQFQFTTPTTGFLAYGTVISATKDGGKTWKQIFQCAATLNVNGLTQNTGCNVNALNFPSTRVGYGAGGGQPNGFLTIVKTEDGGATWRVIFATTALQTGWGVVFRDESHGVVQLGDGRMITTADGGQTWQEAAGLADGGTLKFTDPSVGWACYYNKCSGTVDGGQHWVIRNISLPTGMLDYSWPRRDRAYFVGNHGMIYHYRIVPASYTAPGIVDAPLMPAYGGALRTSLDQLTSQVTALQARLSAVAGSAGPGNSGGSAPAPANALSAPSTANSTSANPASQDTNFSQDTSVAASPTIQSCCGAQVQAMQNSVAAIGTQVPLFAGEFRNLNSLFAGLNMLPDLITKAQAIHTSFLALKQAADPQAAIAALQTLLTQVQAASQAIDSNFQNLTASNAASDNSFSNMAGGSASGATAPGGTTAPANGTTQQSPATKQSPATNAVDQATQKAKEALKKLVPF